MLTIHHRANGAQLAPVGHSCVRNESALPISRVLSIGGMSVSTHQSTRAPAVQAWMRAVLHYVSLNIGWSTFWSTRTPVVRVW